MILLDGFVSDVTVRALDYKTDAIIQTTLRHKLGRDVTVITVAHRLQTIMDANKIVRQGIFFLFSYPCSTIIQMVLDDGRIVSCDSDVQGCYATVSDA